MKKHSLWIFLIVAVLLVGAIIPVIVGVARTIESVNVALEEDKNQNSSDSTNNGSNSGDQGNVGSGDTDSENQGNTGSGATDSENQGNTGSGDTDSGDSSEEEVVRFAMCSEPEFGFRDDPTNGYSGIRFLTNVPMTMAKEIDEDSGYTCYTLVAPLDYFDQVYDSSAAVMDWKKAFDAAGLSYLDFQSSLFYKLEDGKVKAVFSSCLTDIKYTNTNRKFTAISYTKKIVGSSTVYTYASYEEGQNYSTIARSFGYVAAKRYSEVCAFQGSNDNYDELAECLRVINNSVDLTNGQEAETTNDYSKYSLNNFSVSANVGIDARVTLKWTLVPGAEIPIVWYSENSAIATVEGGVVKGVNVGTVRIVAVCCGTKYYCDVTVS